MGISQQNIQDIIETAITLRVFQVFARALPAPSETNPNPIYAFIFHFTQNLADNMDRVPRPNINNPAVQSTLPTAIK